MVQKWLGAWGPARNEENYVMRAARLLVFTIALAACSPASPGRTAESSTLALPQSLPAATAVATIAPTAAITPSPRPAPTSTPLTATPTSAAPANFQPVTTPLFHTAIP